MTRKKIGCSVNIKRRFTTIPSFSIVVFIMRFFVAVLLLLSVFVQTSNGFVLNSGKSVHLKRGPFGSLKMAANGAVSQSLK
jgi:hypothetical protein